MAAGRPAARGPRGIGVTAGRGCATIIPGRRRRVKSPGVGGLVGRTPAHGLPAAWCGKRHPSGRGGRGQARANAAPGATTGDPRSVPATISCGVRVGVRRAITPDSARHLAAHAGRRRATTDYVRLPRPPSCSCSAGAPAGQEYSWPAASRPAPGCVVAGYFRAVDPAPVWSATEARNSAVGDGLASGRGGRAGRYLTGARQGLGRDLLEECQGCQVVHAPLEHHRGMNYGWQRPHARPRGA